MALPIHDSAEDLTLGRLDSETDGGASDEDLIEAFQTGDEEAFNQLFRRYYADLVLYLKHRVPKRSIAEAEDLAVSSFWRVASHKKEFQRAKGSFRAWLFTIAANLRCDFLRSLNRRIASLVEGVDDHAQDVLLASCPDTAVSVEEWVVVRDHLSKALRKLTQRQRDVLLLTCWEGFTYAETAEILNVRPGSVAAHRDKALKKLRTILEDAEMGDASRQHLSYPLTQLWQVGRIKP